MINAIKSTYALIRTSVAEFSRDNLTLLAAATSYNLLLSLFPFVLIIIAVSGFVIAAPDTQDTIIRALGQWLPISRDTISRAIKGVVQARGATSVIAFVLLVWGGLSFFDSIRRSINTAWGLPGGGPILRDRLADICMIACAALLLALSLATTTGLAAVRHLRLDVELIQRAQLRVAANYGTQALNTLLTFAVFLLLYKFIPRIHPRWRDIWPGALGAVICFELIKYGFVWYLEEFAPYDLVYGSLGGIIAFLVWTYFSAVILLFFAKLTAVRLRLETADKRPPAAIT